MRSDIIRQLEGEYQLQRQKNDAELALRQEEACRKNPQIGKLLDERQQIVFSSIPEIISHSLTGQDMGKRMEQKNREIAEELVKSGFPADYLEPRYRCPICRDTGYVGEPIRERCQCMQQEFFRRLYREVGLNPKNPQTFSTFDLSVFPDTMLPDLPFTQRQLMALLRQKCETWADSFPECSEQDVFMWGESGLGKTYLMNCMADRLLQRGFGVLVISAWKFLDAARSAYFAREGDTGARQQFHDIISAQVLMIDDVGSEPLMENITVAQFFNMLNERQIAGLSTVISTNLTEEEFRRRYTERVSSRLSDSRKCLRIQFRGSDIRTKE